MGKIVDTETKDPIEGVVVFIEWDQKRAGILGAGTIMRYAQETVTDKNGDFSLPGVWVFNPWRYLTIEAHIYIYKSGYEFKEVGPFKKWKNMCKISLLELVNSEDIFESYPMGRPLSTLR